MWRILYICFLFIYSSRKINSYLFLIILRWNVKSIERNNATATALGDFPFSSCDSWCVRTLRDAHSNGCLAYPTLFVAVILQSSERKQFRFKQKEPRLRASLVTWLKRQSVSVHHEIMHWMKLKENITLSAKHVSVSCCSAQKRLI